MTVVSERAVLPPPPAVSSNPLLAAPILSTLVRLSLPNIFAMLATAIVAVAETAYVGSLGVASLAGMALAFPLVMLQQMMSAGAMGGGISSAISRALGAGEEARAEALAWHALVIGAGAGLFFTVLFLGGGRAVFAVLGGQGAALEQALTYGNVLFVGFTSVWLTNTLASIVRGGGNMRVPSLTLLAIGLMQITIGGTLGLGLGPFPRLGMAGVASGQVAAFTAGALFLAWYLRSGRARVRLVFGAPIEWPMLRDILRVGALACLSPLQSVCSILLVTRLVASFGTEALAGYGIGVRLEFLLAPIAFAIGIACVPLVGMAVGAGDAMRARGVAWTAGALAASLVGSAGILVAVFPGAWAALFTRDAAVLSSSASYFAWAGPGYAFFGLGMCLYFGAQGAGHVLGPVLAQTVRLLIIAAGGWWLTRIGAPAWQMFALVSFAMVAYGLAAAFAVYRVPWGALRKI